MRHIDEDTITQAVIARHAHAADARLRDVMTSLVQHLHAFAREVRLTEAEWRAGLRFLAEAGRLSDGQRQELALLSGALGLSTLVTALQPRRAGGGAEVVGVGSADFDGAPRVEAGADIADGAPGERCFVRGRVAAREGGPLAGAEVKVVQPLARPGRAAAAGAARARARLVTDADGAFHFRSVAAEPCAIPHDGPVGRLLDRLGRHPWRPGQLHFAISAPGHAPLHAQVFRAGDRYLDSDALFGVRRPLVVEWVPHPAGRGPDGTTCDRPYYTVDVAFVLEPAAQHEEIRP